MYNTQWYGFMGCLILWVTFWMKFEDFPVALALAMLMNGQNGINVYMSFVVLCGVANSQELNCPSNTVSRKFKLPGNKFSGKQIFRETNLAGNREYC